MKIIDLSQTIDSQMPLFSSNAPKPAIRPWQSHAQSAASGDYKDCTCEISEVQFVTSIGTYLDSPYHFDPGGLAIDEISLDQVVLPGIVIDCTDVMAREPVSPDRLAGKDITGKAVLFKTGWSQYWGQMAYYDFPFISEETGGALLAGGAKLAGVDCLVIDDTNNPRRPVHTTLLKNNILIVENLSNLEELPDSDFIFHAAPVKFRGAAAFPVRAYATLV